MERNDLYNLQQIVNERGVLISFAGPFSHGIIEEIGQAITRYLESETLTKAYLMDVFSVFVEQAQNVRNYATKMANKGNNDHDFNNGIVTIGKNGSHHVVCSGNLIQKHDTTALTDKLNQLRYLDAKELKTLYKQQLRKERQPGEGGGLGLIDMSRKSAQPLAYEVRDLGDEYCFFSLCATI